MTNSKGFTGKHTEETKLKISLSKKGQVPWNKGKTGVQKSWNKGKTGIYSDESRYKMGSGHRGKKLSKEHIIKCLKRNPISSLEAKFIRIIKQFNLPFKFVGDGSFLVGRKSPDFIDTFDGNVAVEVFYTRHKDQFRGGCKGWKESRSQYFRDKGWGIVFINEVEMSNLDRNLNEIITGWQK